MKFALLISMLSISALINLHAQENLSYDKALADSLGADERGMTMYQFVLLKTGTATITNKDSVNQIFAGHMQNITRLVKDGLLIVAGPFGKNDLKYRGLFIFKAKNKEGAEKLLATDPAISSKLLAYELVDWYGSAALPMYLPYSEKISISKL